MDEQQKAKLDQMNKLRRGAAIIEGTQDKFRQDGYTNLLNKYGTAQDNSTAYTYEQEPVVSDLELIRLYEGNGLFTKIIDRPSEEAVKHGFDIDYGDEDITEYVDKRLDDLDFEDKFATAEKWARLYGGSLIVMLCDDGGGLEEPLNWDKVTTIEELRVFERAVIQEDYTTMYNFHFFDTMHSDKPFGQPEYYHIYSMYGYFTVHYSRCLVFRNGRLPEQTTNSIYRYWGMPEYVKIKRALRECITSHSNGTKLLERSVQAIYKMKNLANLLSTEDGENKVLQRLQVIDMARGILNSMAIDAEGEDYDFKTLQMSGVKDVIDTTCNMLSAVTNIPQTILFGRSPAGMNATGDSDLENYYNMVENIQKQNMKANARTVIDLILKQGLIEGKIPEIPKYKMKFAALWSLSDTEQADIARKKAATEQTKAQTAQVYIDSGVLDPSEVRSSLATEGEFDIEEVITEDDLNLPEDTFSPTEMSGTSENDDFDLQFKSEAEDGTDYGGAAVLVIKNGKILCATGMAAIISNYATDLPRADVKGAPSTAFVKSLGASYGYSVQDMRASRMAGKSLDTRRAEAARYAVDRTTNIIAFAGDKKNNLVGVLSTDNNIPLYTLSEVEVDSQKYTDFKHKTAAQILDDINGMFAYQAKITKGVEHADTLMLPHSVYIDISTRQIPNTGYTVLRFLKENAPYLKDIVSAPELESDAEDTNPYNKGVMFLYTNSADKFSLEIPMPFYQYPLQNRNLEVIVPCEERVAGCIIYYPLSALIAVGA